MHSSSAAGGQVRGGCATTRAAWHTLDLPPARTPCRVHCVDCGSELFLLYITRKQPPTAAAVTGKNAAAPARARGSTASTADCWQPCRMRAKYHCLEVRKHTIHWMARHSFVTDPWLRCCRPPCPQHSHSGEDGEGVHAFRYASGQRYNGHGDRVLHRCVQRPLAPHRAPCGARHLAAAFAAASNGSCEGALANWRNVPCGLMYIRV